MSWRGVLEEDNGIDGRPAAIGIGAADPIPDEGKVEAGIEMTIKMIVGNQGVEGNDNGRLEGAGLDRTEHGATPQAGNETGRPLPSSIVEFALSGRILRGCARHRLETNCGRANEFCKTLLRL
jgi:hypothetical protein